MSTEDDIDCGHDSWSGLMRLLDEHWPDDIFHTRYGDDPARDAGPRIVSLIRLVDRYRADADNWRRVTTGDPTQPLPLAEQARELLLRVRELEATVARVRTLADSRAEAAERCRERAAATHMIGSQHMWEQAAADHDEYARALRAALDGDQ